MREPRGLDCWVEQVEAAAVAGMDASLREAGFVQPPTVHLFRADLDPPYLAYVVSRPFYRGADAASAIAALSALPAAVGASRVLVCWEHSDLGVALQEPNAHAWFGLVTLDADEHGSVVGWHPAELELGSVNPEGLPTAVPHWGPVTRTPDGPMPTPITELLTGWRTGGVLAGAEFDDLCEVLEEAGYRMRWISRATT